MIDRLIKEVNTGLDNECYLSALIVALTLPDICGKVAYPNDGTTSRYKKWYHEWIGQYECNPEDKNFPYPSADMVYDLRCSLMHTGNPDVDKKKQNIVDFKLSITEDMMHMGSAGYQTLEDGTISNRTLEIGIKNLCWKLCRLAKVYYDQNKDKFHFNYTLEKFPDDDESE